MRALIVVTDLLARSRLQEAATAAGYTVTTARALPEPAAGGDAPDIVVVDLDLPGALEGVRAWRTQVPAARVVGYAFHTEEALLAAAREAGAEVVAHSVTARPARIFTAP